MDRRMAAQRRESPDPQRPSLLGPHTPISLPTSRARTVTFGLSPPPSLPRPCSVLPPPPGPRRCFKGRRRGREGIKGREGGLCFVLMSEREQPSGCCSGADGSGFKPRFVISPSSLPSFSPTPCRCAWIAGLWRLMFGGRGRRGEGEDE